MLELFCPLRECGGFQQIPLARSLSPSEQRQRTPESGKLRRFFVSHVDLWMDGCLYCVINLPSSVLIGLQKELDNEDVQLIK